MRFRPHYNLLEPVLSVLRSVTANITWFTGRGNTVRFTDLMLLLNSNWFDDHAIEQHIFV